MAEEREEETSVELSPQALAYFNRMLDDTVFIKRQQWAVTNYTALIYAAIIWLALNIKIEAAAVSCVLITFSIIAGLVGIYLLIRFQIDLFNLRQQIEKANNYSFGSKEKAGFTIRDRDPDPLTRGGHILAALILVCIAGAVLSVMAVLFKAA